MARAGLDPATRFGPTLQDRLADMLLNNAGLTAVREGAIACAAFRLNLARVWAGLPTATGHSYYHGVAGNRAVLSHDGYRSAVGAILGGSAEPGRTHPPASAYRTKNPARLRAGYGPTVPGAVRPDMDQDGEPQSTTIFLPGIRVPSGRPIVVSSGASSMKACPSAPINWLRAPQTFASRATTVSALTWFGKYSTMKLLMSFRL
ncbi:hypothetical protein [Roseovarius sp. A-2]|uniref:hypothetical protein n=1 Tax=Roseovarius sp. A-2 TaxID=1570360 RepID=UPI001117BA92|nr:hypothetical protein [Roseovarius sp. A-2]